MENIELITKALNYIKSENTKNNITIDDVAKHAGFSADYFNRIFFAHSGFNIMEYVRFCRMKNAARLLRITDKEVLDIAFECGYEAHESFSRAFKNQYGMSPSEYRKRYENSEAYYGDFNNGTVAARLLHEFKDLKLADSDEVIDWLLETDSLSYGYIAVCFYINGGVALYSGEDFREGVVLFTEWGDRLEGQIVCNDWDKIAEYRTMFSDSRFDIILCSLKSVDTVKDELSKREIDVENIQHRQVNVYTGKPYPLSIAENISMKLLKYEDAAIALKLFGPSSRLNRLKHELYQRDVLGNSQHSVFAFGIFKGDTLIGLSEGGLQGVHGFVINNCVVTSVLPEYESEELYRYAFKFITNAALEKGALPIDDIQTPNASDENKSGAFNSVDLGYKTVLNHVCM